MSLRPADRYLAKKRKITERRGAFFVHRDLPNKFFTKHNAFTRRIGEVGYRGRHTESFINISSEHEDANTSMKAMKVGSMVKSLEGKLTQELKSVTMQVDLCDRQRVETERRLN